MVDNKETFGFSRQLALPTESTKLNLIVFCPWTSGLLLNEMFLSAF